ncbi:MAG: transcription factor S [Acidilobaceae archaeon]|nr:transcription factor S [Acidilobaceae archaeon]
MLVNFCPRCGSVMQPRAVEGRREMYCPKCGYATSLAIAQPTRVEIVRSPRDKTNVITKQAPSTMEKVKGISCPKCGHDEAFFWMMQTRAADEPPTRFYRCAKCGHTWREYA